MIRIAPVLYWEFMTRVKDVELKSRALIDAKAALESSIQQRNDVTKRLQKKHRKLDLEKKDYRWDDETTSVSEVSGVT